MRKWLTTVCVAALAAACGPPRELAPLKDGLYLEYEFAFDGVAGGDSTLIRVEFKELDGETYEAVVIGLDGTDDGAEEVFDSFRVDRFFEVDGENEVLFTVMLGPLWLQPALRHEGEKALGGAVLGMVDWEGMRVVKVSVTEDGITRYFFYDPQSGFLAGAELSSFGSRMYSKLEDTNCDIRPDFL
jgi:hypothetical protein